MMMRLLVIDVRTHDEFSQGHIPGAVHIPIDDLPTRLSEIPKEKSIVSYCNMRHRGNSRGERAAKYLQENGFKAFAIDGGFVEWNHTGLPIERT
ncbi:rhodanese-like domain-containing protein [Alicyclobacillus fastidiosus]|uniref:Rhodanese-like domain-containing protein n=1 Tax=Alicyclobacillus fastidiosus TaxID=392011 RepID=A0ABV5AL68_9BACL|nr:rhodanese-like domain-containing protein [Alicyclobacillus fastidiosus]WEH10067.1 rhodanese-like domain-containing protein [Alicyclobacillus fastidiosus]